jgi:hypothetical protein
LIIKLNLFVTASGNDPSNLAFTCQNCNFKVKSQDRISVSFQMDMNCRVMSAGVADKEQDIGGGKGGGKGQWSQ